jgi:hypothetical protein
MQTKGSCCHVGGDTAIMSSCAHACFSDKNTCLPSLGHIIQRGAEESPQNSLILLACMIDWLPHSVIRMFWIFFCQKLRTLVASACSRVACLLGQWWCWFCISSLSWAFVLVMMSRQLQFFVCTSLVMQVACVCMHQPLTCASVPQTF